MRGFQFSTGPLSTLKANCSLFPVLTCWMISWKSMNLKPNLQLHKPHNNRVHPSTRSRLSCPNHSLAVRCCGVAMLLTCVCTPTIGLNWNTLIFRLLLTPLCKLATRILPEIFRSRFGLSSSDPIRSSRFVTDASFQIPTSGKLMTKPWKALFHR